MCVGGEVRNQFATFFATHNQLRKAEVPGRLLMGTNGLGDRAAVVQEHYQAWSFLEGPRLHSALWPVAGDATST
jgi:hypothetical protein